ncbi:unnamed protein product [Microthlaspi erraticum]|uniref:Uncharacterized protein n=1 Tax=Microthlaspi erraticum TaxID=1685480 RepID=A0A6D2JSK8_9BRAS|nr:unnamed protein product [Microthlaspi erraticum]
MRIEGEKGVKTQSAPKHWPRTRKRDFGRANSIWPTVTVEPGRNKPCSAGYFYLRDRKRSSATREPGKKRSRSAEIFVSERTDRAGRSGKHARPRPNLSAKTEFGRPNRSTATKSIGHRPKTFLGQEPLFLLQNHSAARKSRPGKLLPAVGHATPRPRTTKPREPGVTPRGRATHPRTTHERAVRPGKLRPASGRDFIGQVSPVRPQRPTTHPSDPDRSDSATIRFSGRSSRTTVPTPRSTRSPF